MTRLMLPGALLGLMACNSCQGCAPGPSTVDTRSEEDTQDTDSGGEDSPGDTDTAPPPPCEFPELEPNNGPDDANPLDMQAWGCGIFDVPYDFDMFEVTPTQGGWLKVDVDAVELGSPAAPFLFIESESGLAAGADAGVETTDPLLVVPVPTAEPWVLSVNEGYNSSGEEFEYRLRASVAKPPLEWDATLGETSKESPMQLELGERVYGVVDSAQTVHWVEIPVPSDGKTQLKVEVMAHRYGSPLNGRLAVFRPDDNGDLPTYASDYTTEDPSGSSWDPIMTLASEGEDSWVLSIKVNSGKATGELYWFVFQATEVVEE